MQFLGDIDTFIEGEAIGIDTETLALLVIRKEGIIYVYENRCPHRGIRLEWQANQFLDYEKQFIQCAMHGALFTIKEGTCVAGPCPGERLTSLPFIIKQGKLYLKT